MWKKLSVLLVVASFLPLEAGGQDTKSLLENAAETLGATDLKSIRYSGTGFEFRLGQSPSPGTPWPPSRNDIKSYTVKINYKTVSRQEEAVLTTPRGEAGRLTAVSGPYAWDTPWGGDTHWLTPFAADERRLQIWMTPHGLIQAAAANHARIESQTLEGQLKTKISFTLHGKFRVDGILNQQNLVEKASTWIGNTTGLFEVLGDMPVETYYSNYKDFAGIKFPTEIVQKYGGFPILDISVTDVRPNAPADIRVPQSVRGGTARQLSMDVQTQPIAEGVWYLTGIPWHSVAVEFKDHVVVVEGPFTEEWSIAVLAELRKIIPGKPVRYLVNTHHHFDHSGGIRAYAAEGTTIVTHEMNRRFYEKVFAAPRTLIPDRLAQSRKKANFESFTDRFTLTDGVRTMELYHIEGSPHATGIIMAYLTKEKLLIEADVYTPAPAGAPAPATANPASVNLYENIQRLKLEVDQIAPLHGRPVPISDLLEAIGAVKKPQAE